MSTVTETGLKTRQSLLSRLRDLDDRESWRTFFELYWRMVRFNAGWDFYHGSVGKGYVGVPDPGAPIGPNEVLLYGGPAIPVSLWPAGYRTLTALPGRVGIGTTQPIEALDVRGNIRLGVDGELRAMGGEENLRIVRGKVLHKGQIVAGSGFTVTHSDGSIVYRINFTTPFPTPPTVTATVERSHWNAYPVIIEVTQNLFTINFKGPQEEVESTFHFMAVGPR